MATPEDFQSRYKGKGRERYNKALRAESPIGNTLLDTLELLNQARHRRIENLPDFLTLIEDRLQQIRDQAIEEIKTKYNIGPRQ